MNRPLSFYTRLRVLGHTPVSAFTRTVRHYTRCHYCSACRIADMQLGFDRRQLKAKERTDAPTTGLRPTQA